MDSAISSIDFTSVGNLRGKLVTKTTSAAKRININMFRPSLHLFIIGTYLTDQCYVFFAKTFATNDVPVVTDVYKGANVSVYSTSNPSDTAGQVVLQFADASKPVYIYDIPLDGRPIS